MTSSQSERKAARLAKAFAEIDRLTRKPLKPRRPLTTCRPDGDCYIVATAEEAARAQRWVDRRMLAALARAEWPPK